jgi:hypothetical protein
VLLMLMWLLLGLGWALHLEADADEADAAPRISDLVKRPSRSSSTCALDASGSLDRLILFLSVLPALAGLSRSLPADETRERVAVEAALLRRRNLERALCRRVLMLLMPASSHR